MRTFGFLIFCLVALAAGTYIVRPAALGDASGAYAYVDRALPQLAAWRAGVMGASAASQPAQTSSQPAKPKAPPVTVTVKAAETKSIDISIDAIGTVQAINSVVIKPRADSQVVKVAAPDGATVKQGDLIFKLDDTALQAQLAQAEAQIAKDKATLEQNKRDLARNEDLLKQKFVAPQAVETVRTTLQQTQAQIGVDEAARNAIATSITYMTLTSPVTGRIGTIAAKAGADVKAGDALATVNQIDPIYVAFSLPQSRLDDLRTAMAAGHAQVRLKDAASSPTGTVAFIENSVDTTTGTISVKASMPNKSEKLWPGAFANIVLVTGTEENAVVVPSAALQIGLKGPYVFLADGDHAKIAFVQVERSAGDDTVVKSGVNPGDQVVVQGLLSLTDGAAITISQPSQPQDNSQKSAVEKTASQG